MNSHVKKVHIGIAGQLVAGKTTASNFFINHYDADYLKFSKILDMVLDILDLPKTRKFEQDMGVVLKQLYGPEVLANALLHHAKKSNKRIILFDGLRKPEELQKLKTLPNFKMIFIKADLEKRYQRMKERVEKVHENLQSFEEFKQTETHAADKSINELEKLSDYVIQNNGTREEYIAQLKMIAEEIC